VRETLVQGDPRRRRNPRGRARPYAAGDAGPQVHAGGWKAGRLPCGGFGGGGLVAAFDGGVVLERDQVAGLVADFAAGGFARPSARAVVLGFMPAGCGWRQVFGFVHT